MISNVDTSVTQKNRNKNKDWRHEHIRAHNDIGAPPAVGSKRRRNRATKSLEYFLKTYFDDSVFYRKFGKCHLQLIDTIQQSICGGENMVVAMPRGSGKTTILQRSVLWGALCGHSVYPILVTGDDLTFQRLLKGIKVMLETSDALLEDWPEVLHPIRSIEGNALTANFQLCEGERTHLKWSASALQFPTTKHTISAGNAGCFLGGGGLTSSRLRGCVATLPDGRQIRPDVCLVDDPSTRESAKSGIGNQLREDIIKSDIAKMGGPGKKMSVLVACTVIYPDDLAERLLSKKRSPKFTAIRQKMIESFPSNMKLWEEYGNIRRESMIGDQTDDAATKFYKKNKKKMDHGCVHYWPDRIEDGFHTAIESAMAQFLDDPRAFASECQNEPEQELASDLPALEPNVIVDRQSAFPRRLIPPDVEVITAHIDCQEYLLYWMVCGFTKSMKCYIIDNGAWPEQPRKYFVYEHVKKRGRTLQKHYGESDHQGAFRQGLSDLVKMLTQSQWERHGGGIAQLDLGLIDARFQPVEVEAALHHARCPGWAPAYGVGIGAKNEPLRPRDKKTGQQGLHWVAQVPASGRMLRSIFVDVNYWKSEVHKGLTCPELHAEAILLPKDTRSGNQLLAETLCSEVAVKVEARGRTVNEWQLKHSGMDNHPFDNLVGCFVAANVRGINKSSVANQTNFRKPKPVASTSYDGSSYEQGGWE